MTNIFYIKYGFLFFWMWLLDVVVVIYVWRRYGVYMEYVWGK